ncbi:unnamed protein product, partial [Rotaria magnacalcarata]
MWKSNLDPWNQSQPAEWSHYSDAENRIIEEAYTAKQTHAILDDYCIDFQHLIQISNNEEKNQRPVKRLAGDRNDKRLREERFIFNPIAPKRPFGGHYGWISPFITEVRQDLKLNPRQLPSQDDTIRPMIVEKAAFGIIEEGKKIGKQREAKWMAEQLMAQKENGMKEVWKCCAHLYSMESFLYKKLNEIMRLIGSEEHEHVWRSKIRTFGPFCLLLWDDPINKKPNKGKELLYRGANLTGTQIATYRNLSQRPDEYRSFQAFTSCSRNRTKAEIFGNALFIIKVSYAFTVDLSSSSEYPYEEEELIAPAVCFTVQQVEFDETTNKHLIYLDLRQRFN